MEEKSGMISTKKCFNENQMSNEVEIALPKLGESIVSASVVQWFKKEGDSVELDEPLLEVSTDKVNSEIPSPVSGVLKKIIAEVDQEYDVGATLAIIETGATQATTSEKQKAPTQSAAPSEDKSGFFSPAILRMAREANIPLSDLERIKGTGAGGRVTKQDLEKHLSKPEKAPQENKEEQRVKMTGLRKAIADNIVRSFYEAPHATLVTEVDVTNIKKYLVSHKESFFKEHGYKLTITSFIVRAICSALKEFPIINSFLDGDTIVVKNYINLGIAVSVDQGIVVPVISQCQSLSLEQTAKEVSELSNKARTGSLTPGDTHDGTITLTNFGMSGVQIGIPIIRYPEVAIIGIGAIEKKVIAFDDERFGIRDMMHISLTFDHRVLDGMYGCAFLNSLKKHIEKVDRS